MEKEDWQIPKWWYRETRPSKDSIYFENMCHVMFQAGLNWQVTEKKWPTIKDAFCNFNIQEVASFTEADVARLLQDSGIIRNKGKIQAAIRNAITFKAIEKQYGSFQKYLDSLDKSNNYANAIKELVNTFKWLGPPFDEPFLVHRGRKNRATVNKHPFPFC